MNQFQILHVTEVAYKDPEAIEKASGSLLIMKWLDLLETYLKTATGVQKIPLAYLVRANKDVMDNISDPKSIILWD